MRRPVFVGCRPLGAPRIAGRPSADPQGSRRRAAEDELPPRCRSANLGRAGPRGCGAACGCENGVPGAENSQFSNKRSLLGGRGKFRPGTGHWTLAHLRPTDGGLCRRQRPGGTRRALRAEARATLTQRGGAQRAETPEVGLFGERAGRPRRSGGSDSTSDARGAQALQVRERTHRAEERREARRGAIARVAVARTPAALLGRCPRQALRRRKGRTFGSDGRASALRLGACAGWSETGGRRLGRWPIRVERWFSKALVDGREEPFCAAPFSCRLPVGSLSRRRRRLPKRADGTSGPFDVRFQTVSNSNPTMLRSSRPNSMPINRTGTPGRRYLSA